MGRNAIAASIVALASIAAPALAQDRALLQLDWIPTGEHAAYFAGVQRGFWRENGIELSLTRGYGSGDTVTKLAAGAAQFGVADLGAVLAARARQNVPVRSISEITPTRPTALVPRSSWITTFRVWRASASRSRRATPPTLLPEFARAPAPIPERISGRTPTRRRAALLISGSWTPRLYSIHHYYRTRRRAGPARRSWCCPCGTASPSTPLPWPPHTTCCGEPDSCGAPRGRAASSCPHQPFRFLPPSCPRTPK